MYWPLKTCVVLAVNYWPVRDFVTQVQNLIDSGSDAVGLCEEIRDAGKTFD